MRWHRRRLHKPNPDESVDQGLVENLAQLYAPREGPFEMDTRFESALQERRAEQLNSPQPVSRHPKLSPRWGITGLAVAAVAILAAVVAVALPSGGRSNSVAEAIAFLQQIPPSPELEPGVVIHRKTEQWSMYGANAGQVTASESWGEVGPGNTLVKSYSRTTDETGTLIQEGTLRPPSDGEPGIWRTVDARTGQPSVDQPYQPVPLDHGGRSVADLVEAALADGRARVLGQTAVELSVEIRETIPADVIADVESRGEVSGPPSHWDLKPRVYVNRITFREDGVLLAEEMSVITESGDEVLYRWWRTSVYETIDHMPPALP